MAARILVSPNLIPALSAALLLSAACHGSGGEGPRPVTNPTPREARAAADSGTRLNDRGRSATEADWNASSVTRVEELLAGRFPGVRVIQSPRGISVRIRGTTTIYGNTEPLYVVDGMPLSTSPEGLIALNPHDIAKIEVLKDPADLAMYGFRGANGVVLITTKRGR